jgi:hypothetical protein
MLDDYTQSFFALATPSQPRLRRQNVAHKEFCTLVRSENRFAA